MTIKLYQNLSDTNEVNKNIILITTLTGTFRKSTSLINPIIEIESSFDLKIVSDIVDEENYEILNVGIDDDITFADVNYIYIEEFKRYYFVNDIQIVSTSLYALICEIDVLMSFKEQFLQLDAFVTRNEFDYDVMVKDDFISYYYDKEISEITLNKGDKVNTTFTSKREGLGTIKNCLLSVINDEISNSNDVENSPSVTLPDVSTEMSGDSVSYKLYCCTDLNVTRLAKKLLADNNLYGFIISAIILPFEIEYDSTALYLKLGNTYLDGTGGVVCYNPLLHLSKYYVIADFTITGDSFLDYEPYTQYQIWLPYLSWVDVSADDILNNRIIVYYVVDYQTGGAQVTIYDVTNGRNIFTSNCQLGVKIGFSSTNAREVKDNQNANNIGLGIGLLTSALSITGGVVTANPIASVGGLISGGNVVANYVQNQNTNYNHANGCLSSSNGGLYQSQDVKVRKIKYKPKNYDSNYASLFGKPLNQYKNLSELSGFTKISEIHLDDIDATKTEIEKLYVLLNDGVRI